MLTDYPARPHWLLYSLLFALLLLLTPQAGNITDVQCWVDWATRMHDCGFTSSYEVNTNNYNPLYQYVLLAYSKLAGSTEHISRYRHIIKAFTLLFDFGGVMLAVRAFGWGDGNQRFMLSLLFLFNVGYLYNTLAWEQVDAILGTLAFAAVVQALRQRVASSMVLFLLAINMKTQGIIFLPPMLLLWAPQWWLAPRQLGRGLLLMAVVQLAVLAPYIWAGKVGHITEVVVGAVDYYPIASMNCYNLWVWLLHPYTVPDTQVWAGLTFKQWGLLGFLVSSAVVLLPLGLATLHKLRSRTVFNSADYALVVLSLGLIPLTFCFFNTQMHERYWHPALLLLGSYALLTRRYFLFMLFSLAYFLNLEAAFKYQLLPGKVHSTVLFWPETSATLFAVVLVVGTWQLYRHNGLAAIWQQLRAPGQPAAVAMPA